MTRQSPAPTSDARFGPGLTNPLAVGEGPSVEPPLGAFPLQPFHHLDTLWVQVAGSVCNLTCTHCFVSCGPHEHRHTMMTRSDVASRVAEGLVLGVKDIYFTGGEPLLHPELEALVEDTLALAPLTLLTNGTLFTRQRVVWLEALTRRSRYSLELRVSLDGTDAATHDGFRGAGAWLRAMAGLRALSEAGLLPIVTLTRPADDAPDAYAASCAAMLRAEGVRHPRLKFLPMFRLGREAVRSGGYPDSHTLAALPSDAFDPHRLQCGSCRAVTSRGVYVCPLLVDEPVGRMGDRLAETTRPFALSHSACATCWVTGMTCANI